MCFFPKDRCYLHLESAQPFIRESASIDNRETREVVMCLLKLASVVLRVVSLRGAYMETETVIFRYFSTRPGPLRMAREGEGSLVLAAGRSRGGEGELLWERAEARSLCTSPAVYLRCFLQQSHTYL